MDENGQLKDGFKPDYTRTDFGSKSQLSLPKHSFLSYHNCILYEELDTRADFHKMLMEVDLVNRKTDSCTLVKRDFLGRIVGGLITFTGEELDERVRDIERGFYTRDDEARKRADVPGFDLVKSEWVQLKDKSYPLYHRTHLVPYRFCLNDGEYGDVIFTGTARLNSGFRADSGFIPTDEDHDKNVRKIVQMVSTNPFAFVNSTRTDNLSLDDFERAVGNFIHRSTESYTHTYKYGVECFYYDESLVPSQVSVVLTDVTAKKTLFAAVLDNKI